MRIALLGCVLACMAVAACTREDPGRATLVAEAEAAAPFYASIVHSNHATRLTNRYMASRIPPGDADLDTILLHLRAAIDAAGSLDNAVIMRMHPEMPSRYSEFQAALVNIEAGLAGRDAALAAQGHMGLERWADWVESNSDDIRFPPRFRVRPVGQGE